jgi:hypothetical protein
MKYEMNEEPIGILTVDVDKMRFSFDENPNYDSDKPLFLRKDFAIPFEEVLKIWILNRAPEPDYEFIDCLVEKAWLKEYDAYGFFKYNNGRYISDRFYFEQLANSCTIVEQEGFASS